MELGSFHAKALRKWMCDGLIINYTHHIPAPMVEAIDRHRLPCIWLNCGRKTDCVRPDDVKAGRLATQPLLDRGCKRIVFLEVGANDHDSVAARHQGYKSAIAAAGRNPEIITLPLPGNVRAGMEPGARAAILRDWLNRGNRPDGVVTYSAWTAEPMLYAAAQLGIEVPGDLAVTTIEDEPALHLGRTVTTVVLDIEKLASAAVEMLFCKIDAPSKILPTRKIEPRLVPGDTA
jgi:DNA-binding LacI/PurR family transcriptional regulator